MKRSLWSLFAAAALLIPQSSLAEPSNADLAEDREASPGPGPGGPMDMHPGMGMQRGLGMGHGRRTAGRAFTEGRRALEGLDLTTEQRERLRELRFRQQRRAIQMRADLQVARLDLRTLVSGESPSRAAIDAQIDRIAKLRADLEKARVATLLESRALLTSEQRRRLRDRDGDGDRGLPRRRTGSQ